LRLFRLSYKKQSEPQVLQRASVNNGKILMNRLESYEVLSQRSWRVFFHGLATAKKLAEGKLHLEDFVSAVACFVRQIEPAEKTVHASKQGRDDAAYSSKLKTGVMPLRCIPA
jgi:hypothetical protein